MSQINEFNQGGPELPVGSVTVPELPGPEVWQATTSVLGYESYQEKLLPFILEEKQKQEHRRTLGESGRKVNT